MKGDGVAIKDSCLSNIADGYSARDVILSKRIRANSLSQHVVLISKQQQLCNIERQGQTTSCNVCDVDAASTICVQKPVHQMCRSNAGTAEYAEESTATRVFADGEHKLLWWLSQTSGVQHRGHCCRA